LMWAWRVLSPGEPFTEGVAYEDTETQKVVVILSDGRNWVVANNDATRSDYNSYGYLAAGRLGTTTSTAVAEDTVDAKLAGVCECVEDGRIRLYTILFQVDFESIQDLSRDCASVNDRGEPLYAYVPEPEVLETASRDIGEDLTSLRIT